MSPYALKTNREHLGIFLVTKKDDRRFQTLFFVAMKRFFPHKKCMGDKVMSKSKNTRYPDSLNNERNMNNLFL